jgi:hypothetical protein
MRQRGYGAPPSATNDITTSSSSDEGRSIRSDSNRQPFETPPGPHGTGALYTGTSRTPVTTITPDKVRVVVCMREYLNRRYVCAHTVLKPTTRGMQ